ncbi:MAG TPA: hypothetical protein VEK11_23905 [Thermoanaerobaculia bacterium]|nr:hypothetical protein [Thermoanaerobaculia bacterium]
MKSTLFSLVLSLCFATVANAALVARPEVAVTASTPDVAPFDQASARLASDGDSFLAVWADRDLQGSGDIHGARLRADGSRVDASPLVIAASDGDDNRPELTFGAGRYLVVWSTPTSVLARFVGPDASLSEPIVIASDGDALTRPHVAFNGRVFLVVWEGPGLEYRGAVVDTSGRVTPPFPVATAELTWPEVALATVGETFYFVSARIQVEGTPGPNGFPAAVGVTPIDANGVAGTRVELAPATTPVFDLVAAQSTDEFMVAWTTSRGIGGAQVRYARFTAAGAQPVESFGTDLQFLQDVVADGAGYLLIYGDDNQKHVRRAGSSSSAPLPAPPMSAALDGAGKLVLVRAFGRIGFEFGPAGGDLYVARTDVSQYTPLVVAPRHQESPDVAAAGDLRLAVWCEYVGMDRALTVMASRITGEDRVLDPAGLDFGVDVYHPTKPRVASNGAEWFAVWVDARTIYGARIERNGTVTAPFTIASDVFENTDVDVAWDGSTYVVVFTRGMFLRGLRTTVRALRVNPTGPIAGSEVALSSEGANEQVAVAGGGDGSLIVFRSNTSLAAAMLSRGGTVTPVVTGVTPLGRIHPFVAWNGLTFLVASATNVAYVNANGVVTNTPSGAPFVIPFASEGWAWAAFSNDLVPVRIAQATGLVHGDGASITYARKIGHATRELARVFVRKVEEAQLRRRAVQGTR